MGRSVSRKRPWLAALLAALVTGLGHLYLRRWRRAIGWLAALFGVTALFVEPAALEALGTRDSVDLRAVAPLLVVASLSVFDAYLLARAQNEETRAAEGGSVRCPNCGKELDPDIEFCQWCTTEIEDPDEARPEDGSDGF